LNSFNFILNNLSFSTGETKEKDWRVEAKIEVEVKYY